MEPTVTLVAPDAIDVDFVPAPVTDVAEVKIDDEVLLVGAGGFPLVLNPTGALVWQCLDGEVSLGELITEFSEELDLDAEVVQHDVVSFVRSLGNAGLLTGVGVEFNPDDFPDAAPATPIDVGDELEPFTLSDLDGVGRSLTDWRGRPVLVVNWSPGCGYCTAIASHLGELHPHFTERGVDLLFVSSGDADTNRSILADAGLDAPMLLKGDAPDPFAGFGTPLAYLLDADGRVSTSVGWGADQVLVLAQDIAGVVLANNPFARSVAVDEPTLLEASASDEPQFKYIPAPGGMCGPGGGGSAATNWAGTVALEFDDWHIGIRHNGEYARSVLDQVFPGARVVDSRVPDNFSLALSAPSGRAARELHLLVQGSQQLVRSRSASRVMRGLLTYLSATLNGFDTALVNVQMAAIVRDGTAWFVPNDITYQRDQAQPRLAKIGFQMVDAPLVLLDPTTNELVIPEPQISYDRAALEDLDRDARLGSELPGLAPGRYPLGGWVLHSGERAGGPVPRAEAVAALLPVVAQPGDDLRSAIDGLITLVGQTRVVGVSYEELPGLVAGLKRL